MTPGVRAWPSPNCDARPPGVPVDMLILHYTGMADGGSAIRRLRDPRPAAGTPVSAHYVVEEDGTIFQLVEEPLRAWHAGVSFWRGQHALNGRSIGVEIVNPGHEHGYRDFPVMQLGAVLDLCQGILGRWPIPARNVVAHSDVAPDRKQDPGELFPWAGFAAEGVGLWPDMATGDALDADAAGVALTAIGYGDFAEPVRLAAFQRHWAPDAVTGILDDRTARALDAVRRGLV